MFWAAIAWGVVPVGTFLVMLLLTGRSLLMSIACGFLGTPIKINSFAISLPMLVIAVCGVLCMISYGSMQRYQHLVDAAKSPGEAGSWQAMAAAAYAMPLAADRNIMSKFHHERNLWISLCGIIVWIVALRLSQLRKNEQLVPPTLRPSGTSFFSRLLWFIVAGLCLAVSDIPICRLNYHMQLATHVTPMKNHLLSQFGEQCADVKEADAEGACQEFCGKVREVSNDRLQAVLWTREWHVLGKYSAELFDVGRGVEQGEDRINALFAQKTCVQLLQGVDKSNANVNLFCMVITVLMLAIALGAFAAAVGTDRIKETATKTAAAAAATAKKTAAAASDKAAIAKEKVQQSVDATREVVQDVAAKAAASAAETTQKGMAAASDTAAMAAEKAQQGVDAARELVQDLTGGRKAE